MHNLSAKFFFNQAFATLALIPHPQREMFCFRSFLAGASVWELISLVRQGKFKVVSAPDWVSTDPSVVLLVSMFYNQVVKKSVLDEGREEKHTVFAFYKQVDDWAAEVNYITF